MLADHDRRALAGTPVAAQADISDVREELRRLCAAPEVLDRLTNAIVKVDGVRLALLTA